MRFFRVHSRDSRAKIFSSSAIVFEPADDLVAIDQSLVAQVFVVVQIGDAGHGYGFADDGAEDVTIGAAAVDRDVSIRGVECGDNLAVPAQADTSAAAI